MRIDTLKISNFKAISHVELSSLQEMVIVAGANGSGKSCIFDAIRLLKSAYGGYQPNEWQSWFGEFQIRLDASEAQLSRLMQSKHRPLVIAATFVLSQDEVSYLRENASEILLDQIWREEVPGHRGEFLGGGRPLAENLRKHEGKVLRRLERELPQLLPDIASEHQAQLTYAFGDPRPSVTQSRVLEIVFGTYKPGYLGVIDYHSASRNYAREQVGGINLNIEAESNRLRQHALYNSANKYNNLKTEMASIYVRHLLAKDAGVDAPSSDLTDTLKELFATFFPGKEFLGPQPTADGAMAFPVRTPAGQTHDIDDLSSGEKEVLYGYLRLRNSAPKNSILLIDEPELHLNPRLVRGLASFYHAHIGKALGNQLWLLTHSDTLIREAVGQGGFRVFHMQAPGSFELGKQITPIEITEDFDRAVIDIVGDLAAYRPGAKVVVFEGGGGDEFDVRMTCSLFPSFQQKVNAISGGSKRAVGELYKLLDSARERGAVRDRFFAITDRDSGAVPTSGIPTVYTWDRYHIENYLLEPKFIIAALRDLNRLKAGESESSVNAALVECAKQIVPDIVSRELSRRVYDEVNSRIDLKFRPNRSDVAVAMAEAVTRSVNRLQEVAATNLTLESLARIEGEVSAQAEAALSNGNWRTEFPGRSILRRFAGKFASGVAYETFRDLVLARMRDATFQPDGMAEVVKAILKSYPESTHVSMNHRKNLDGEGLEVLT